MEDRWRTVAHAHWGARDFGEELDRIRPSPVPWADFAAQHLFGAACDFDRAWPASERLREAFGTTLSDSLTALQELVLGGDSSGLRYWVRRRRGRRLAEGRAAISVKAKGRGAIKADESSGGEAGGDDGSEGALAQSIRQAQNEQRAAKGLAPLENTDAFSVLDSRKAGSGLLQFAVLTRDPSVVLSVLIEMQEDYFLAHPEQAAARPSPAVDLDGEDVDVSAAELRRCIGDPDPTALDEVLDEPPPGTGAYTQAGEASSWAQCLVRLVNTGDFVTGATPLHFAVFTENPDMISLLASLGADPNRLDNYFGSPLDYARMLGLTSTDPGADRERNRALDSFPALEASGLQLWDRDTQSIKRLSIAEFEKMFDVTFTPLPVCDFEYVEELLFSGLKIEPSEDFRKKYFPQIYRSSGDEHVVLAHISEKAGYGAFAGRRFSKGDFVVRYGGRFRQDKKIRDRAYCMSSGVDNVGCDATFDRNMGGMINHAPSPPSSGVPSNGAYANVQAESCFDRGCEQAVIIATRDIEAGEQLLLDYSGSYWTSAALKEHGGLEDMASVERLPLPVPEEEA
jgi:SET domain/Ankyrin repeat